MELVAGIMVEVIGCIDEIARRAGYVVELDEDQPLPYVLLVPREDRPIIQLSGNLLAQVPERWRQAVLQGWIAEAMCERVAARLGYDALVAAVRDLGVARGVRDGGLIYGD